MSRTTPRWEQERKAGYTWNNFRPHRPGRDMFKWDALPDADEEAEFQAYEEAAKAAGYNERDAAEVRSLVRNRVFQNRQIDYQRAEAQADKSYHDGKRRRTMNIVNQAVARDVPPQGPFQRSFIPQDLWHMLSPNRP